MTILERIIRHVCAHQDNVMTCCDFIVNKKELHKLLENNFMKMAIAGEILHEIRCMDYGYIGEIMGVKLYLFDDEK